MTHERSDTEVERLLETYLEDEAARIPQHVLWSSVHQATQTDQVGSRHWRSADRTMIRFIAVAGGAAVVLVAVMVGSAIVPSLRQPGGGPGTSPPGTISPSPDLVEWDAGLNFVGQNPAPDGYGHRAVWSYLYGPGCCGDSPEFSPLTRYSEQPFPNWSDPDVGGLHIGAPPGLEGLQIQPVGGAETAQAPIVAWRHPDTTLPIRAIGTIEVDGSCGDGVILRITTRLVSGGGDEEIQAIELHSGRDQFDIFLPEWEQGQQLYFILDPRGDSRCDTAWLTVRIYGPAPRDDPSPGTD